MPATDVVEDDINYPKKVILTRDAVSIVLAIAINVRSIQYVEGARIQPSVMEAPSLWGGSCMPTTSDTLCGKDTSLSSEIMC